MVDPNRWRLVGLETEDPDVVIPDGAYAIDGTTRPNGVKNMIGRITSTYYSPTLKRSIAMGLVEMGPEQHGRNHHVCAARTAARSTQKLWIRFSWIKRGHVKMSNAVSAAKGASFDGAVRVTDAGCARHDYPAR